MNKKLTKHQKNELRDFRAGKFTIQELMYRTVLNMDDLLNNCYVVFYNNRGTMHEYRYSDLVENFKEFRKHYPTLEKTYIHLLDEGIPSESWQGEEILKYLGLSK